MNPTAMHIAADACAGVPLHYGSDSDSDSDSDSESHSGDGSADADNYDLPVLHRVVTIAAGTTTITKQAHEDQADIVEVIFPASLVKIEDWASILWLSPCLEFPLCHSVWQWLDAYSGPVNPCPLSACMQIRRPFRGAAGSRGSTSRTPG